MLTSLRAWFDAVDAVILPSGFMLGCMLAAIVALWFVLAVLVRFEKRTPPQASGLSKQRRRAS